LGSIQRAPSLPLPQLTLMPWIPEWCGTERKACGSVWRRPPGGWGLRTAQPTRCERDADRGIP